jgi:pimeloyl-ACP methyl ester carboxylesterase
MDPWRALPRLRRAAAARIVAPRAAPGATIHDATRRTPVADGLLLLHAFPLDGSMWDPQVAAFGSALPVVAPHDPGFGGTAGAGGDTMTMEAAADAALRALDAAGVERACVCGLSMGGYVALAFLRKYPQRVCGLVLANTRADGDDEAAQERRRGLAGRLRGEGNGFLADAPPPLLSPGAPEALWQRARDTIRRQPAEAIAAAALGMAGRADQRSALAGIAVPTLVITSSGDTLIPPEITRPIADQVPGATLEQIEGAGHLSNLEAPEAFNRALRAHLVRCGLLSA